MALSEVLINVDAGEAVSHFSTFMKSDYLQIVSLVTAFHKFEELLWVLE